MAKLKAIFDADILINIVKTNSSSLLQLFDVVYVADYVWNAEIINKDFIHSKLQKMINKGLLKVLEYNSLTDKQRKFYLDTYNILDTRALPEFVDEGEKITAAYAKAHNLSYYMSDDNKASPHIKSIANIDIVNFSDLLYLSYSKNPEILEHLSDYYNSYIGLFEEKRIPGILRNPNGAVLSFAEIMGKARSKFELSENLNKLVKRLNL